MYVYIYIYIYIYIHICIYIYINPLTAALEVRRVPTVQGHLTYKNPPPPWDPIVGLCLGS